MSADLQTPDTTVEAQLLTAKEVATLLAISIRTVWRLVEKKTMPPPVRFNRKMVRWDRKAIERWIAWLNETPPTASHLLTFPGPAARPPHSPVHTES